MDSILDLCHEVVVRLWVSCDINFEITEIFWRAFLKTSDERVKVDQKDILHARFYLELSPNFLNGSPNIINEVIVSYNFMLYR